jgi:adenylate cyclase class IV
MHNLEAKFRLVDLGEARRLAEEAGFRRDSTLVQCDTFFNAPRGKLKLREEAQGSWLIHYQRDHDGALELSNYTIAPVSDPALTCTLLEAALGIIAQVRKRRILLMRENVRLHLDAVEALGSFGEIEAVLPPVGKAEEYRPIVEELLKILGVTRCDLIGASYFELMPPVAPGRGLER